jgi:hypothetical protein
LPGSNDGKFYAIKISAGKKLVSPKISKAGKFSRLPSISGNCQIYFSPISFMCIHLESIGFRQPSRTGSACKNSAKNVCYKREAKTGNAFDFVALMPRLDDAGETKRLLVWL